MSSVELKQRKANGSTDHHNVLDEQIKNLSIEKSASGNPQSVTTLLICVGGIYASFLTWGILQERLTTTNYGTPLHPLKFSSPVVLNTIQSLFASTLGYIYLLTTRTPSTPLPIFPTPKILPPLLLVSLTSSLASPFGYASLAHVDYITFTLAKSCKLLPVMLLHVLLGKRYPLHKYLVVLLVTAGVATFTLHHPSSSSPSSKKSSSKTGSSPPSSLLGIGLLSVNLVLDGLTNTTQDTIYRLHRPYSGPQMMCGLNLISTLLTSVYLILEPFIAATDVGAFFGLLASSSSSAAAGQQQGELSRALDLLGRNPRVLVDVLGFAACGALGQVFIFYTLATFGSLLLVTVTVTRKMLTMILSVLWFGHRLSPMQWVGVGLVFGGVGIEAQLNKQEKLAKTRAAKADSVKST